MKSRNRNETLRLVKNETDERSAALDERAEAAKQSKVEAERLIEDFKVFLRSRVFRYSIRADESRREEMYGTAMMALYEAIQKYEAAKGHFFPFADQVVCKRLIDFNRKMSRHDEFTVSLDDEDEERESAQSAAVNEVSIRNYQADRSREQLAEEIEQFKAELSTWGLTMASLVDQSPKHDKLRKEYRMAISKILQAPDIIQTIQIKRYFPIKAIEKITGLHQKKLERARSYVLASLIIKMGDYDYLSEYTNDRRYSL